MKRKVGDYSNYVKHPRYGRGPRFTDVCPRDVPLGYRFTTYISDNTIGGTAVAADLDRQASSPVPVLYYFDLKRLCVECGRPFIFFAEEQNIGMKPLGLSWTRTASDVLIAATDNMALNANAADTKSCFTATIAMSTRTSRWQNARYR